jgi:hypothetical protein
MRRRFAEAWGVGFLPETDAGLRTPASAQKPPAFLASSPPATSLGLGCQWSASKDQRQHKTTRTGLNLCRSGSASE